ncbi:hypothetical protein ACFR9U_16255 [Halorientalis brevis]|uniref:Uncharacterized protein n=1 Tax=Halorientalis brevis TaxID=1126241 RepID=A0ABD6CEQ9_9EURY|nr:hypothetical protein [Halorientalis brevis]
MANRVISVFGTYDFLAKSMPGMTLVLGIIPLLPSGLFKGMRLLTNFLVFVSFLVSVLLVGTLLGEVAHTIGRLFEKLAAWFGRRLRNTYELLIDYPIGPVADICRDHFRRLEVSLPNSLGSPNPNQLKSEEGSDSIPLLMRIVQTWLSNIREWMERRIKNVAHIALSHRRLFLNHIEPTLNLDSAREVSEADMDFTHQNLVEVCRKEYNIHNMADASKVYSVVVGEVAENGEDRPFRYQARSAFCRGMWVVLMGTSIVYGVIFSLPVSLYPTALRYPTMFAPLLDIHIYIIAIILLISSFIFAIASGAYKEYYIEYLITEFYQHHNIDIEQQQK